MISSATLAVKENIVMKHTWRKSFSKILEVAVVKVGSPQLVLCRGVVDILYPFLIEDILPALGQIRVVDKLILKYI